MFDYFLPFGSACGFALSFVFQKLYQSKAGDSAKAGLLFNMLVGIITLIIILFACGFSPDFSVYSVANAAIQAVLNISYIMISFYILSHTGLSLYSLFLMSGGMIVPYVFGVVFLGEALSALRTIGLAVITAATAVTNIGKEKSDKKVFVLCVLVFFLNGFTSVMSKVHQIETKYETVGTIDLLFWIALVKTLICAVGYFAFRAKSKQGGRVVAASVMPAIFLAAVSQGIATFLNLKSAVYIPATVLFPLITGVTIIFSALSGYLCFKEKISKNQLVAIAMCFAGTCMLF